METSKMYVDKAPPVRVVAIITLFASTLDLFADMLLCHKLYTTLDHFCTHVAYNAAICYFVFTGISVAVYACEMADVFITLKYDEEKPFYARLAKSMMIVFEEVPLPLILCIIFTNEPHQKLANPAMIASCVKFVALVWGIVKFMKLKFCWPFQPCCQGHGWNENVRRCCMPTCYKICMCIVNICHLLSIIICFNNIIQASHGGRIILKTDDICTKA